MAKWTSVEEELPSLYISVLVYLSMGAIDIRYRLDDNKWSGSEKNKILYWRDLPPPPKEAFDG